MNAPQAKAPEGAPEVAACAEHRAQPAAPYTIADAINDARFYRRQPEAITSDLQSKRVIDTLLCALESSPVYLKAVSRGQRVFVLVEQDRAAPYAMRTWAEIAGTHGCTPEKVHGANAMAHTWDVSPSVDRKWPD